MQHREQRAHLRERLPAGLLDEGQGLAGALRLALGDGGGHAGLDGDGADMVCYHVVQLARDVGALLPHRPPGILLPLRFQAAGALLQLREIGASGAHVLARAPATGHQGGHAEEVDDAVRPAQRDAHEQYQRVDPRAQVGKPE